MKKSSPQPEVHNADVSHSMGAQPPHSTRRLLGSRRVIPNNSGKEHREMETPLSKPNPVLSMFTQLLDNALGENAETAQRSYRLSVDDLEHTL